MVTPLARALLTVAVHRSPVVERDDNRREWEAELAVLTAEGHPAQAVKYAASLALARHHDGPPLTGRRFWHAFRLIVVAPVLAAVLVFVGIIPVNIASQVLSGFSGSTTQSTLMAVFVLGLAVPIALLGRHWAVNTGTAVRILAATVPGLAVAVLFTALTGSLPGHTQWFAVFFAVMAGLLAAANTLYRRDRTKTAWALGITGAVVAAEVTTVLMIAAVPGPAPDHAWSWLFVSLTGYGVGGMSFDDTLLIWDVTGFDNYLLIVFTALALGSVLTRGKTLYDLHRRSYREGDHDFSSAQR